MSLSNLTKAGLSRAALVAAALGFLSLSASVARAADEPLFEPGQPIITGFSGALPPEEVLPDGADPLDYTFINPDGNSMIIYQLEPGGAPGGQLIDTTAVVAATAAEVGQVFAVTLDNAPELTGAAAPNIYLAATSAYGLNLVMPGPDGVPVRARTGDVEASFAPGQWGGAGGEEGYPGSIWKIDGTTGEVTLFSTIATNTGAGLGDLIYDPSTSQFFVSDLDTGLIYRLASDGTFIDTYDHGIDGLAAVGLDPIEDDGSAVDVTDPGFDTEDSTTWGFTQPERRVHGLGLFNGRLFYTAFGPEIWSVRLNADGSFGAPRWELDVADVPEGNEITHIVFDPQGRMLLAERGAQVGSYDYSTFAAPGASSVLRYKREFPDDQATPSTWVATADSYAVGMATDGANGAGGLTLGPDYNEETGAFDGACNAYLWTTGDSLRNNPDLDPPLDPPFEVSGLQGNERFLRRPWNDPPLLSFFVDYDGNTEDDQPLTQGHVGGVAMWQDCTGTEAVDVPDDLPPPDYVPPPDYNLSLEKWASPYQCFDGGANWWCSFTIRVENTSSLPYWGPVVVNDELPLGNPGATMHFWPTPPWNCSPTGPTSYQCARGLVLLYPGDAVVLHETVQLPKAMVAYCHLPNVANLEWGIFGPDGDPGDDFGLGVTHINAPGCAAPAGSADLALSKSAAPPICFDAGVEWACRYAVLVQNVGPGDFSGPITVQDTLGVNANATTVGPWACLQAGPVLTCNIIAPPVNAPPGWNSGFLVTAHIPKNVGPPLCDLDNKANISSPAPGTPMNAIAGNDFDQATTHVLHPACFGPQPQPDLELQKSGLGCVPFVWGVNGYLCQWQMKITNVGPDPFNGLISFEDKSIGTTLNTLKLLYPFCTGPHSNVTCDPPGAIALAPAASITVPFHTFYPDGPAVCSATNGMSILAPAPGSPLNPAGNDADSVGQSLPNPACFAPGAPKLNIQKTATGCIDDPGSIYWLCDFDIDVLNYGGGPQPGPIVVKDFNDKPTTFSTPACVPSGVNQWTCTRPNPLNSGAVWHFEATTQVDPNGVTLADCNVTNTVLITTPLSADPGHFAQANQKVPQLFINLGPGPVAVYCDPPSLKLTKTAEQTVKVGDGYDATFRIRATSTGPDPYHGTIELDEILPDGTTYVKSSWPCVPTTGNDMHCSSPYKDLNVGQYTTMTITIHIPRDVAVDAQCDIVNTVNASISAEVLHSAEGVQYTASASAKIPASVCRTPIQCPADQAMPGGGCCDEGLVWNGKQCAAPPISCPRDSVAINGECECKDGTSGTPGKCKPDEPICPDDSRLVDGECECLPGTEGRPGRCEEVVKQCPRDSVLIDGECECREGTQGTPGKCKPIVQACPRDSVRVEGQCECREGTHGTPGKCQPDDVTPACPKDSRLVDGRCQCLPGTEGRPGRCQPVTPDCPADSHFNKRQNACVCDEPLVGTPGECRPEVIEPQCPADSHFNKRQNACVCDEPLVGTPGECRPEVIEPQCPADSHFNKRQNACVCDEPLVGTPGECHAEVVIPQCPPDSTFNRRQNACVCNPPLKGEPGNCQLEIIITPAICPDDSHFDRKQNACVCNRPLVGEPGKCAPPVVRPQCPDDSHFDRRKGVCVCNEPLVGEPGACVAELIILR